MGQDSYIARSYAKINLGLYIRERLPNGYHDIETGFVFIDLSDRLEVTPADKTTIECNLPDIPTGKDNLIVKAVQAFNRAFEMSGYYHVKLTKNIPAGAGLGGGSSNAAAMLHILNKINKANIPVERLAKVGAALGADVPVFVYGKPAVGTGTGTDITLKPIQPDRWILTVMPEIHSNTAEAYAGCEPGGPAPFPIDEILTDYDPSEWPGLLRNDLEPVVVQRFVEIGDLRDQLYEMGAVYAAMSGSGSSVFGIFEQEFVALEAYQYLIQLNYRANLTKPGFKPDQGVYLLG